MIFKKIFILSIYSKYILWKIYWEIFAVSKVCQVLNVEFVLKSAFNFMEKCQL